MITNPWKFSFPDAVHFNFHLSLTLKTVQSYPGVFSSFRTTNLKDLPSSFKRVVIKTGFDQRRITHHCNRSVSSFSLLKSGVITACGTNSRENSFSGTGASGMFWWTKNVSPTTIRKRKLASKKTGNDVTLFLSGICDYIYFKPTDWEWWGRPVGSNLHSVSPRRVERGGGHLGPLYKRRNGQALRLKCLYLQVNACIWGILEALIRASFVWRRANAQFIEMTESCALIVSGLYAMSKT